MIDLRLNKLAKLLVNYSTKIKKGDFVLVSCEDIAIPWMTEVVREAIKAGAHVETYIKAHDVEEVRLRNSSIEQLEESNYTLEKLLEKADVWISAWGTRNTKSNTNLDSEILKASKRGETKYRVFYSERMGNGSLRWCGTQFPTYADAQEGNMSLSEYEDFVYGAGLLNSEDPVAEWNKISQNQARWAEYLNTKKEIHIISKDTDIYVDVSGRKWINCDGRVNFPDGEIFTSPVQDRIEGKISFSLPGIYMGSEIEGIKLTIEKGKVVHATAAKGEKLLKSLLEVDEGASYFGEVAIGTNYGIKNFTRNMLFDEKIGGTVHMAIGDSFPEAGGLNKSSLHWDMLCNMRDGGRIYGDGELFYKDGEFLKDILK